MSHCPLPSLKSDCPIVSSRLTLKVSTKDRLALRMQQSWIKHKQRALNGVDDALGLYVFAAQKAINVFQVHGRSGSIGKVIQFNIPSPPPQRQKQVSLSTAFTSIGICFAFGAIWLGWRVDGHE